MDYEITHQPEQSLFQTQVEGRTAFVQYRLIDGSLDIIHTIVPRPLEGKGIAAALVKAAYDYALAQGLTVKWLERHPVSQLPV
ncbi:MAG: GNAT family N-acetyltransferase [Bacteroides sp.]